MDFHYFDTMTCVGVVAERGYKISHRSHANDGLDFSGWAGIRTQGTRKRTVVFKTTAFDHSATHPETVKTVR